MQDLSQSHRAGGSRSTLWNSLILLCSEGIAATISALMGFLMPRKLSVADFGRFAAALSFAQIAAILVDSGMGPLAARNIARERSNGLRELNQTFSWRLWVNAGACVLILPTVYGVFPSTEQRLIALCLTLAMFFITLTDFFCWIFKGTQQAGWCAFLQIFGRGLLLLLCFLSAIQPHPLPFLLFSYVAAGAVTALIGIYAVSKGVQSLRPVKLTAAFFRSTVPGLYQVGAFAIISVIFARIDTLLVSHYCGEVQSGLYACSLRVLEATRLIPTVALGICLPVFSKHIEDKGGIKKRFVTAFLFLFASAMAMVLVGSVFAKEFFPYIFGLSYGLSAEYFKPLLWSCPLMASNVVIFALLCAAHDYRHSVIGIAAALSVDIALATSLLPLYGPISASWARFAGELLLFSVQLRAVLSQKILQPSQKGVPVWGIHYWRFLWR